MLTVDKLNTDRLINGLKNDKHYCFKQLYESYSPSLYQFSYRFLKSKEAAEDVVQEVFTKLWQNRKDLKTGSSFRSYLFTIALNTIRKQFNKLARFNEATHKILQDLSVQKDSFDERLDYQDWLDRLNMLINKMPEKRKQVFIRKKIKEKSLKEISEELGITTKTVEYHITESMKYLKCEFQKLIDTGIFFFYLLIKSKK